MAANVLNILLAHQKPAICQALVRRASTIAQHGNLLLAYGGTAEDFAQLGHEPKIFIKDPRLRTRDHQRELQSYTEIFRAASDWMKAQSFEFIHFFEYDHVPLVADLNDRQLARLQDEAADVLGFRLMRIDDTSHPHFLQHTAFPEFPNFVRQISCRKERNVVLSMLLTGSFWTRDAFESVGRLPEPCPVYMEVYLPTLAHHLGFRLRDYGEQDGFVSHNADSNGSVEDARRRGAWTIHPVKDI